MSGVSEKKGRESRASSVQCPAVRMHGLSNLLDSLYGFIVTTFDQKYSLGDPYAVSHL